MSNSYEVGYRDGYRDAEKKGKQRVQKERAQIVAWLRDNAAAYVNEYVDETGANVAEGLSAADAIERGEHEEVMDER